MADNKPTPPPPPPPPKSGSDLPGESNLYAFIIGIDNYINNGPTALTGCASDVSRIVDYLQWRYFSTDTVNVHVNNREKLPRTLPIINEDSSKTHESSENIKHAGYGQLKLGWLRDEEATKDNIKNSITTFFEEATAVDYIWLHFSGYGTSLATTNGDTQQYLVCYDHAGGEAGLLAIKEIEQLLSFPALGPNNTPNILFTRDCCYSNSIDDPQMEDHPKWKARGLDVQVGPVAPINADSPTHVSFSACFSDQLAVETSSGGLFTQAMIDALETNSGNLSYADLHVHTRAELALINREHQSPQLQVFGNASAYTLFLNNHDLGFPVRFAVRKIAGSWAIDAGAIHHVPKQLDRAHISVDVYESIDSDQIINKGVILQVGAQSSRLMLSPNSNALQAEDRPHFKHLEDEEQPYFGRFSSAPFSPIHVLLDIGDEASILQESWPARAEAYNIIPVLAGENVQARHDLTLSISTTNENRYRLKDEQLGDFVNWEYDKDEIEILERDLLQIAKWKRNKVLSNNDSELKDKVQLKLSIEGRDEVLVLNTDESVVNIEASINNDLLPRPLERPLDRRFRIRPKVMAEGLRQDLYCYLLWFYDDYRVELYAMRHYDSDINSGLINYPPQIISVLQEEASFKYHLKLLVTTSPLDEYRFVQQGVSGRRGGLEESLNAQEGLSDWYVIDREIHITRNDEAEFEVSEQKPITRKDHMEFDKSHAFVIGINEYPDLQADLNNAVQDAKDVAMRLKAIQGFDNVLLMLDTSYVEMMALLDWLKDPERPETINFPNTEGSSSTISWIETTPMDSASEDSSTLELRFQEVDDDDNKSTKIIPLFEHPEREVKRAVTIRKNEDIISREDDHSIVFYFAGHGFRGDDEEGTGFLAPSDAKNRDLNNNNRVSMDEVYKALVGAGCLHTLLILDCCFSGQFKFATDTRGPATFDLFPMSPRRFDRYKGRSAWQVLASAGPNQLASDSATLSGVRDNSPFTHALKNALEGFADLPISFNRGKATTDGVITATELYMYVWDNVEKKLDREGKVQHPNLIRLKEDNMGEFIFFNPKFNRTKLGIDPSGNPYKGLFPYEKEDSLLFFGRNEEIKIVADKVKAHPVVLITSPSAYGKSSLVKAGVFPHLKQEYGDFELLILRPGASPWSGDTVEEGIKTETAETSATRILYYTELDKLKQAIQEDKKQLILIDQYEEIFTETVDEVELEHFKNGLLELRNDANAPLINGDSKGLRIVITLRSDYEWELEASDIGKTLLGQRLASQEFLYRLGAMSLNDLRQAPIGPASAKSYEFEAGLAEQILKDVFNAPGALPLLSFTMQEFHNILNESEGGRCTEKTIREYSPG